MTIGVLVIECGDGRLKEARVLLQHLLGPRQADYVTLPGAGICLEHPIAFNSAVDGKPHVITSDFALEQVHFYLTRHPTIEQIWLIAHHNCGATETLGLTKATSTEDEVKGKLWSMYRESIGILEKTFRLPVYFFYQTLSNTIYEIS